MNGQEQRRHPRVPVTRPVRIRTSGGVVVQARMVNISEGGVAVLYDSPAEIGARLELAFTLVVRGREIAFNERCVAVYNYLGSNGYIIGFNFEKLGDQALEALREFIAHKRSLQDR